MIQWVHQISKFWSSWQQSQSTHPLVQPVVCGSWRKTTHPTRDWKSTFWCESVSSVHWLSLSRLALSFHPSADGLGLLSHGSENIDVNWSYQPRKTKKWFFFTYICRELSPYFVCNVWVLWFYLWVFRDLNPLLYLSVWTEEPVPNRLVDRDDFSQQPWSGVSDTTYLSTEI